MASYKKYGSYYSFANGLIARAARSRYSLAFNSIYARKDING